MKKLLIDNLTYNIPTSEMQFVTDAATLIGMDFVLATNIAFRKDRMRFIIDEEPIYYIGYGMLNKSTTSMYRVTAEGFNLPIYDINKFNMYVMKTLIENGGSKDEKTTD